ncbi:MAG TPA: bifunctional glutamate N-acetyltransferase/amino-acid acetyltransferase ArgJ [Acidobacteriota bacterium]|nr:bifunctional glutamate N-acetyltransferase/amino-acid acetyltransferase ArgJ [Acidobacteriota bacterium]
MNKMRRRPATRAGMRWKAIRGGVTAPRGYLAAGVSAAIKRKGLDLAVLFSSQPATGAAVFTTNQVQAAPVVLSRKHLRDSHGRVRAVLLNSGCANACTGERGMRDAILCVRNLASHLEVDPSQVVVASTGVIGQPLPIRKVLSGIGAAVSALNSRGGDAAMRAIMTTDTREKTFAIQGRISGTTVRIGGMAKGAGMIHPQLATMLAVITTDVQLPASQLNRILRNAVDKTFNCLTVDGDTSTNDMVLIIANGASGCKLEATSLTQFERGLVRVCEELAKSIARDGEGASKFVEIHVKGAANANDARCVAKAIAHSALVKTALYGEEFNWGRILCAAGYSGVAFNPDKVRLSLCGIPIFRNGGLINANRTRGERAMKAHDLHIGLELAVGSAEARVWTCDLSREYVNINASYIS